MGKGQARGRGGCRGRGGQPAGFQPSPQEPAAAPPQGTQPDFSAAWAHYFRSMGLMQEAHIMEQQAPDTQEQELQYHPYKRTRKGPEAGSMAVSGATVQPNPGGVFGSSSTSYAERPQSKQYTSCRFGSRKRLASNTSFGATAGTSFGQTPQQSTGFALPGVSSTGMFGQTSQPTGLFGQTTSTTSLLGSTVGVTGSETTLTDTDSQMNDFTPIRYQSICFMKEYNKSFEELRYQHYQANRKDPQAGTMRVSSVPSNTGANKTYTGIATTSTSNTSFGDTAGTSFGQTPQQSTGFGFLSSTEIPPKPAKSGLFSKPRAFPQQQSAFGIGVTGSTLTETTVKFSPVTCTDTMMNKTHFNTRHYETKSFEAGNQDFGRSQRGTADMDSEPVIKYLEKKIDLLKKELNDTKKELNDTKKEMDEMKTAHSAQMEDLKTAHSAQMEDLKAAYSAQMDEMKRQLFGLQMQIHPVQQDATNVPPAG